MVRGPNSSLCTGSCHSKAVGHASDALVVPGAWGEPGEPGKLEVIGLLPHSPRRIRRSLNWTGAHHPPQALVDTSSYALLDLETPHVTHSLQSMSANLR